MRSYLYSSLFMLSAFSITVGYAQPAKTTSYLPNHQQVIQSYINADKLDSTLKKLAINYNIKPNWQPNNKQFWYTKRIKNNETGYYLVDAEKGLTHQIFDNKQMADAISAILGKPVQVSKLRITKMFFSADEKQITFKTNDNWLKCDLNNYHCTTTTDTLFKSYDAYGPLQKRRYLWEKLMTDSISPDKQWAAFVKDGNIYVRSLKGSAEIQFTTDGNLDKPYGELSWAPDSKHLVAYHIDPKKIKEVYYILSSVPGTTRGQLKSHEYDQPGDEFTSYEPFIFSMTDKSKLKVDAEKIDFFGAPALNWRDGNSRYFTYEKVDRGHQRFRVIEVDTQTGKTRNILDEKTNTFIYQQRTYTKYLSKTHEIVWVTEQDGWRHVYLVDELTGKEKLITSGDWVVRDIDSVDVKKREIWFNASGKNPDEDPYFIHYYRIGFDGKNLFDLTPEKGNHNLTFSPDRKYYIDTYSAINIAPRIVLKNTSSLKTITELEHQDLGELLATGIKLPEVFVAKGRDGKTAIWGVIYRPANMEPNKSYPIIENIYAGPQDSFVPKNFSPINEMQSIAQLGFIVVQIDGMGTANRSKAFHDVCWHNLADAGFDDRILWMQAMAAKYPQADISRVGIYGTSAGGQNSAGALLFHPEFYKAAVSACGCHDNRIDKQWWNEQWMGYPVGPHYDQQSNITNAGKLKGNLLLIVGEADTNVPPESTYRFADALIKHNKYFDLLTIPGMGHSDGGPYGRKKKRDFFVKHLLNTEPPARNTDELKPENTGQ
ncbi:S9 family peptidase [Pedobacter cryoconitis]|uniref:Dipeptidyl aminopeptidase/acylaminoacyl peptidase n=1 Tax=Pedobacter cryoconitis TaxID=188932 RepID=A0A7X0J2W5_9SPHI|nr:S9 family peptidase [Pedobacter cryoconitis]MBB6498792.1 dipeptidyl aminopeptidase/acylaminoacyl peptidase [Pedobacter cryoconitis]